MDIGVIADDFTGGTDIAGFLVEGGLATVQLSGVPEDSFHTEADAVVISLKSRSCPVEEAVGQSLAALHWLKKQNCRQIFFKYCSTFDSTAQGNIGPVTDAIMQELGETFTIISPALPVNGRTVYYGYLFVNGVLLNESGMQNHPITPMRDANLMRLMEMQASGKAANIPAPVLDQGAEAVKKAFTDLVNTGVQYGVTDTLGEDHIRVLGEAAVDMPFVTGGSGLAAGLARALTKRRGIQQNNASEAGAPHSGGKTIILSGSCSVMANKQVAVYAAEAPSFHVDAARCADDPVAYAAEIIKWIDQQDSIRAPLIYATASPNVLANVQKKYGAKQSSLAVEQLFSNIAVQLRDKGFDHFIVAGGETSGVVVQSIGVSAFHIGPQIAPGVPWVRAVNMPISFALKSGNFGDEQFFSKAQSFYMGK